MLEFYEFFYRQGPCDSLTASKGSIACDGLVGWAIRQLGTYTWKYHSPAITVVNHFLQDQLSGRALAQARPQQTSTKDMCSPSSEPYSNWLNNYLGSHTSGLISTSTAGEYVLTRNALRNLIKQVAKDLPLL